MITSYLAVQLVVWTLGAVCAANLKPANYGSAAVCAAMAAWSLFLLL